VHKEARKFISEGYHILYVGKKWHQEAIGVIDEGEKYFTLIETKDDLSLFESTLPLALLTQTTLSVDDTEEIIQVAKIKFPQIVLPKTSDICYATTNRQNAVRALAQMCDTVLVIGSKMSSNSNKLKSLALSLGKKAHLIDDASEIQEEWLQNSKNIGITSWASGPEELVLWVLEYLQAKGGTFVKEIRIAEEKMEFPYSLRVNE
jgi:4-hydroxy-3-methylbut-2-enyl diphosphate reductase